MKLSEIRTLPPGAPLVTTDGVRVAFNTLAAADGDRRTYAIVNRGHGNAMILPRSLRRAPVDPRTAAHPATVDQRDDLEGQRHTITVERIDAATAREMGRREVVETLAVVERHNGRIAKICFIEVDLHGLSTIEQVAQGTARTYGARYVSLEDATRESYDLHARHCCYCVRADMADDTVLDRRAVCSDGADRYQAWKAAARA